MTKANRRVDSYLKEDSECSAAQCETAVSIQLQRVSETRIAVAAIQSYRVCYGPRLCKNTQMWYASCIAGVHVCQVSLKGLIGIR